MAAGQARDDRPDLTRIFTEHELAMMRRIQAHIGPDAEPWAAELDGTFWTGVDRLQKVVSAWESYPELSVEGRLAERSRSMETLVNAFRERGEHGVEWVLPTKAVLSRALGIAKVHFFSSLLYSLEDCPEDAAALLSPSVHEAIEEAVFTRMAEELYGTFVTSDQVDRDLGDKALDAAVALWDGRPAFSTESFCPILRSAWSARTRCARRFGSLLGAGELFELLFQRMDMQFLMILQARFDEEGVVQAFEEFLFDLPCEQLMRVRQEMRQSNRACVGPEEVAEILGIPIEDVTRPMDGPKALYSSFRRRRLKAQHRRSIGLPGPHRTAESYVLEALLRRGEG